MDYNLEKQYSMFLLYAFMVQNQFDDFEDHLDDEDLLKRDVKHGCNNVAMRFEGFTGYLHKMLKDEYYGVLSDLADNAFVKISRDIAILHLSIFDRAQKGGCDNPSVVADCEITHVFAIWYINTRDRFIKKYPVLANTDYAIATDITPICRMIIDVCDKVELPIKSKEPIDFSKDRQCHDALNVVLNRLNSPVVYQEASDKALELNPEIKL
ncbi:MAG: hypothetical protein LKE54_07500 [Prevotella sp.]|nr:hypothetical protein [Prevotella sp.]MCH3994878.1 hypothetical protein [Prevotella sp.]